jgi:hypothetical protein
MTPPLDDTAGFLDSPPPSSLRPTPDYVPAYVLAPAAWAYDVDQATGTSRATYIGEVFVGGTAAGNQVATKADIAAATTGVVSFNTRTGVVSLTLADVTGVGGAPSNSPTFVNANANTPAPGDNTTKVATTQFVQQAIGTVGGVTTWNGRQGTVLMTLGDVTGVGGAAIASPGFTGVPTAPTAVGGTATQQLATTAFVNNALGGAVVSWNGRTGNVSLQLTDVTSVGGAPSASPAFTGLPTAPTQTAGKAD